MMSSGVCPTIGVTSLMPGLIVLLQVLSECSLSSSSLLTSFTCDTPLTFFSSLLPALAYTLDMYRRTGEFYGINEALFSSALAAMVFSILSAQPLTIVGITGLISLFNFTIYDIIQIYDVTLYPRFMCWTGIWAAIFHWLVSFWNLCDYMRYVTDFSSESFGMYVGIIYISESSLILLDGYSFIISNHLRRRRHSQGSGGIGIPIYFERKCSRSYEHHDCYPLLWNNIWSRKARIQYNVETSVSWPAGRLRICREFES